MADINDFIDPKLVQRLEEINDLIVDLGKAIDKNLIPQIEELEDAQKDVVKATGEESDEIKKLIEIQKKAQKTNEQLQKAEIDIINARTEQNKELVRQKQKLSDLNKQIKEEIKAEKAQENSINALRSANKKLRAELDNLSLTRAENRDEIDRINKQINENTKLINQNSDETRKLRANVGGYKDDIKDALGEQEAFGFSLNGLIKTFSTGAGIVAGVSAVVVGLGKAYTGTARGAEDLARASDRLASISNQLGRAIRNGTGDANIFDKTLQFLQASILGVASMVESDLVVALQSQNRQLEIQEIQQEKLKKEQLDAAEVQRQIRDDETISFAQRIAANQELARIINQRESDTVAFQEKRLKSFQTLLKFDEGNIELQKEIARIEFEIADAREEAQGFRSEQLINQQQLEKELAEAAAERRKVEVVELIDSERKIQEEKLEIIEESLDKEIDANINAGTRIVEEKRRLEEEELQNTLAFEEAKRGAKLETLELIKGVFGEESRIGKIATAIQRSEAIKQNLISLGVITTKQAEAESKAAASLPFPLNIPIIAATVAQFVGIFRTFNKAKIPEFYKGTESSPEGLALVAERGRELIETPRGEIYMANNPALVNLERGTRVLTNQKTEQVLSDSNIVSELRQTRKAIQKIPQPIFKNGSKIAERRGNFWREYRNNKHRLN